MKSLFVLTFLIGLAPIEARAWSDEIFAAFLKQGLWHEKVDDNVKGESLTADLIRRIVTKYRAQPDDPNALQDLGLFALAMGIAEWGVADPANLPPDPAGKGYKYKDKDLASDGVFQMLLKGGAAAANGAR